MLREIVLAKVKLSAVGYQMLHGESLARRKVKLSARQCFYSYSDHYKKVAPRFRNRIITVASVES